MTRLSRLRLLLPQLRIAGIFEVTSGSEIDADELWANLMWIRSTVATLQGAPVTVFRAPRQFNIPDNKKPGETMSVTKHMLHLMLDGRYLDALLPSPTAGLLAPVQPPPALALTDGHDDDDDAPEDGEYEDAPAAVDPVASFVTKAEQRESVKNVSFANGRLTDWVKYVTNNQFNPAQAEYLNQVLDRYCSTVADNGNKHTKAAAEKARADYEAGLAALNGQQDDLFGPEYDARQEQLQAAALETARNG